MPNIAVTTYCNLRCPYCFADDMICEQQHNITLPRFREILEWTSRTPENHVGIIGGEPTLHPKFSKILEEVNRYCRNVGTTATLFTNGIKLDPYLSEIGQSTGLLINCNSPENMTAEQWTELNNTLEHMALLDWFHPGQPKANLGCNLYLAREDYGYFWELVDRYKVDHFRLSVTAPIEKEMLPRKEIYYAKMKKLYMAMVEGALERDIHIGVDCNQIPNCYFNEKELDKIFQVSPEKRQPVFCEPVIDITPDFTATACVGCYDPVDCRQFETVIDLRRYLLHKKNYPRVEANCTGKCKNCKNHELLLCQGGCLAFAQLEKPEEDDGE